MKYLIFLLLVSLIACSKETKKSSPVSVINPALSSKFVAGKECMLIGDTEKRMIFMLKTAPDKVSFHDLDEREFSTSHIVYESFKVPEFTFRKSGKGKRFGEALLEDGHTVLEDSRVVREVRYRYHQMSDSSGFVNRAIFTKRSIFKRSKFTRLFELINCRSAEASPRSP